MISALELIFSPSAASVILFTTAVKCGAQSYIRMKEEFQTKDEALRRLSDVKKKENWGNLSFRDVDFENGSGRVIVNAAFETIVRRVAENRKTGQPCCNFLRGFLTGYLSELFGKSITFVEEKCAGKGDEYCEFMFK